MSALLEAAIRYANSGYAVFPCVNGINPTPLTKRGFKDASTDPGQIESWWKRHPDANIGLATDDLLVIDVDGPKNSWLTKERADELGKAPIARTPRGGWHLVFRRPAGAKWRCSVGRLAPQVDVRTDGGYIVVAPSKRPDGDYHWVDGRELNVPADQLLEPPRWLVDALNALVKPEVVTDSNLLSRPTYNQVTCVIPNGQRNATLASIAGRMRQSGLNESEILAGLDQVNRERCLPPLEPKEVAKVASSISRYQPSHFPTPSLQSVNGAPIGSPAEPESNVIWFSDIEPVEIAWLWPARIPAGRITLLVGLPGKGKSLATIDAAARVSTGMDWPDGTECPQGSAILITAEDNPNDTIRPRLDAAGADVNRVGLLSMIKRRGAEGRPVETPFTLADVFELENELSRLPDCKLIVIDPIGSFLGSKTDAHRDNEVRAVLGPVASLAEKYGAAVVVVAHRRKGLGTLADDLALGSRAFTGLARAVWHVTPDPRNKDRRLLLPGKNNLAKESNGLAFTISGDPPSLNWETEPVEMNADECLAAESKAAKPGPKAEAREHAVEWLRSALASSSRPAKELFEEAYESAAISKATLNRARKELGIKAFRHEIPGPWHWRLPDNAQEPKPEHLEQLVENLKSKVQPDVQKFEDVQDTQANLPELLPDPANSALDESVATR